MMQKPQQGLSCPRHGHWNSCQFIPRLAELLD